VIPGGTVATAVFDMIGTLFGLRRLEAEFAKLGAPAQAVDLWLAESLRDYVSISHSGAFNPLGEVLAAALPRSLARFGLEVDEDRREAVVAALAELDPSTGAEEGCRRFREAGWEVVILTNGSERVARALIDRAGLDRWIETVLSCESIRVSKPDPSVYGMAKQRARGECWMIAAHGWDLAGAARAGMRTTWISEAEGVYLPLFPKPDIEAQDIDQAARLMIEGVSGAR
jgi:2-haloacid dehalogenase